MFDCESNNPNDVYVETCTVHPDRLFKDAGEEMVQVSYEGRYYSKGVKVDEQGNLVGTLANAQGVFSGFSVSVNRLKRTVRHLDPTKVSHVVDLINNIATFSSHHSISFQVIQDSHHTYQTGCQTETLLNRNDFESSYPGLGMGSFLISRLASAIVERKQLQLPVEMHGPALFHICENFCWRTDFDFKGALKESIQGCMPKETDLSIEELPREKLSDEAQRAFKIMNGNVEFFHIRVCNSQSYLAFGAHQSLPTELFFPKD